jgi:carbon monoxide dehydrogenase subunit G
MEAVMDSESRRDSRDEFDNSFDVPLPPAEAWPVLSDSQRIAPCMPGVELTEVVDESTYHGRFSVPLGPAALAFAGTVKLEELDPVNHIARIRAQGAAGWERCQWHSLLPDRAGGRWFQGVGAHRARALQRRSSIWP